MNHVTTRQLNRKVVSHHRAAVCCAVLLCLIPLRAALAFSFKLSEAEFATWPRHCQAAYVGTNIGKFTAHRKRVPSAEVKKWRMYSNRLDAGMWHGCAGQIWLQRAMRTTKPGDRAWALKNAIGEFYYTYDRVNKYGHTLRESTGLVIARAQILQKDLDGASRTLNALGREFPKSEGVYLVSSLAAREAGDQETALKLLIKGNEVTGGQSAQINYFLGLAYLDQPELTQADIDAATVHAETAYKLGYPLPGLRQKLAAAKPGKTSDAGEDGKTSDTSEDSTVAASASAAAAATGGETGAKDKNAPAAPDAQTKPADDKEPAENADSDAGKGTGKTTAAQ